MMKIYYVAFGQPSKSYGIAHKIMTQAEAMRANRMDVQVLFVSIFPLFKDDYMEGDYRHLYLENPDRTPLVSKLTNRPRLVKKLTNYLKNDPFDFLYMRYPAYLDRALLKFAKRFANKLIIENNTKELAEKVMNREKLTLALERIYGKSFLSSVRASVSVTDEIARYEKSRSGNTLDGYVIPNGIQVDSVPMRKAPAFDGRHLDILFVAKLYRHHGLDRLIHGLKNYSGNLNIKLHVVGSGLAMPEIKQLVRELDMYQQVKIYNRLFGEDMDKLYNQCHIAAGTLGIHRKKMREGVTLKVREYVSRGIPFFLSDYDPDLQNDEIRPYYLPVAGDESRVNISEVVNFARKVLKDNEHPQKMRNYALHNLDMSVKMKNLEKVLDNLKKQNNG